MTVVLKDGIFSIIQIMDSELDGKDEMYGYVDRETGEVLMG
jgi:hypothetical protein